MSEEIETTYPWETPEAKAEQRRLTSLHQAVELARLSAFSDIDTVIWNAKKILAYLEGNDG